jgi:hypothetical protein
METEGSLPCSQKPVTGPYPKPDEFIRNIPFYFSMIYLVLSSHLLLGPPRGLFPTGFPTETLYAFLFCPFCTTIPTHLILLD